MDASPQPPGRLPRPKWRWPRFSIFQILYLSAALAISLAIVTHKPGQRAIPSLIGVLLSDAELRYVLAGLATLGLFAVLIRQAHALKTLPGLEGARQIRHAWALGLGACLLLRLLVQAGPLALPDGDTPWALQGYDGWTDACLDTTWQLLMFAGLGVLVGPPASSSAFTRRQRHVRRVFSSLWVVLFLVAMVADYQLVPFLVHLATNGIEAAQSGDFQRDGTFPSHRREGFFTYRMALAGMAILIGSTAVTLAAAGAETRGKLRLYATLSLLGSSVSAAFVVWFYRVEWPRISPDLSTGSLLAQPVELLAGGVLLITLAAWAATALDQRRVSEHRIVLPPSGKHLGWLPEFFAIAGVGLMSGIALVKTLYGLIAWRSAAGSGGWYGLPVLWEMMVDVSKVFFFSPTNLLLIALFVRSWWAALMLCTGKPLGATPVSGRRVALSTLLFSLLGGVGVPTLLIFGFCSWLGPWWR